MRVGPFDVVVEVMGSGGLSAGPPEPDHDNVTFWAVTPPQGEPVKIRSDWAMARAIKEEDPFFLRSEVCLVDPMPEERYDVHGCA